MTSSSAVSTLIHFLYSLLHISAETHLNVVLCALQEVTTIWPVRNMNK